MKLALLIPELNHSRANSKQRWVAYKDLLKGTKDLALLGIQRPSRKAFYQFKLLTEKVTKDLLKGTKDLALLGI